MVHYTIYHVHVHVCILSRLVNNFFFHFGCFLLSELIILFEYRIHELCTISWRFDADTSRVNHVNFEDGIFQVYTKKKKTIQKQIHTKLYCRYTLFNGGDGTRVVWLWFVSRTLCYDSILVLPKKSHGNCAQTPTTCLCITHSITFYVLHIYYYHLCRETYLYLWVRCMYDYYIEWNMILS